MIFVFNICDNCGDNCKNGGDTNDDNSQIWKLHLRNVAHNCDSLLALVNICDNCGGNCDNRGDNSQIWKLHLRNVVEADRGCYMCQVTL